MSVTINGTSGIDSTGIQEDASGRVGIGVAPNNSWSLGFSVLQIGTGAAVSTITSSGNTLFSANYYNDGVANKYSDAGYGAYVQLRKSDGRVLINTFPSGTAGASQTSPSTTFEVGQTDCLMLSPNGGLGYGAGAGGTVTQGTSRTTAVTINKPTGQITLFSAAGSSAWSSFTVNNSLVTTNDIIAVSIRNGATNTYLLSVFNVSAGSFNIAFSSISGTSVDTPTICFAIIRGAQN